MYLHIGKDILLKKKDILFILNYEKINESKLFQNFLENIDKKNIIDISDNKKKSMIITKENEIIKAYISNISSITLSKRDLKF